MYITEAVTISDIRICEKYPYVRVLQFKDRLYQIVTASNTLYSVGEEVLFFPDGTELPDWLLKDIGMWDSVNNQGLIGGKTHRVVKPYCYARDKDMFSSGFIVKLVNKQISTPNGLVSVTDPHLEEKLQLRYVCKGNPFYFSGDFFLEDISVNKNTCPDLEHKHSEFIGKYTEVQEYVCGRKFYITIHRGKSNHHAFGNSKNIFICGYNYNNYKFLSNTKRNVAGNLFVKISKKEGIDSILEYALQQNSTWGQLTLGIVIKSTAFGAKNVSSDSYRDKISVVDVYVGEVPWGRFLTQEEAKTFCSLYKLPFPKTLWEDFYDVNRLYSYVNKTGVPGVIIRTPDNHLTATLYSQLFRMNFVKKNS